MMRKETVIGRPCSATSLRIADDCAMSRMPSRTRGSAVEHARKVASEPPHEASGVRRCTLCCVSKPHAYADGRHVPRRPSNASVFERDAHCRDSRCSSQITDDPEPASRQFVRLPQTVTESGYSQGPRRGARRHHGTSPRGMRPTRRVMSW